MTKTASQIQGDILALFRTGALSSMISGAVYRSGMRPRGSRLEDAIVIFTAGLPGQIQTGVVTINIYVPDIDARGDGVLVENSARTSEIEVLAQQWVDTLTADKSDYLFSLQRTISTDYESEIAQHFVVVKLEYKYFD